MRRSFDRGRRRQKTADRADPTSPIAFGISPQTLFTKPAVWTIHLGSDVDGPLGKSILTRALHSTTDGFPLDNAAFRLLVRRRYLLRSALQPAQMQQLTARVHTPLAGFPLRQGRKERPKPVPIRSRVFCPLASLAQARVAGSTPIDRPLATVPAHTPCRSTNGRDLLQHLRQLTPLQKPLAHGRGLRHPRPGSQYLATL
jgi:hypothetical protein